MKSPPFSFKDFIEASIREVFEQQIADEMVRLESQFKKRIEEFICQQQVEAKKAAQKMTLEMLHKVDASRISIEFKP